jgi:hypothetical protein
VVVAGAEEASLRPCQPKIGYLTQATMLLLRESHWHATFPSLEKPMTGINVRVGTGSFDEFAVQVEAVWPVLPRENEWIVLGIDGSSVSWRVRCVRYVVDDEQSIRAEVLVARQITTMLR